MSGKRAEVQAALEILIEQFGITSILEFDSISHEVLIRKAMESGQSSRAAAKRLGIGRSTMYRKMREYGIESKT